MRAPLVNVLLRAAVWLGATVWWLSLRRPTSTRWSDIPLGASAIFGLAITAAGVVVLGWAARTLGGGVANALDAPTVLLMRGPFRYVRNPLYMAAAAVFVGTTTIYGLWQPRDVLGIAAVAALVHLFVVYREEPATRRRLGPEYDAYCQQVPRWIPRLSP